jgi:integrase
MSATVASPKAPYLYRIPSRQGVERWYFWRGKGHPRVRILEAPGTAAFYARYTELRDAVPATAGLAKPPERTLGWLYGQWLSSAEFGQLRPVSQRSYRSVMGLALAESVVPGEPATMTDFPLERLLPKHIRILRDRKAATKTSANHRVKVLGYLFKWGIGAERTDRNPAADVPFLKNATKGFHTWTVGELERFEARHPIGTKARLALDLIAYTGARRSDVVKLGRQHVRNGWIKFTPGKTSDKDTVVDLPMSPPLEHSIAACKECGDLTFIVTRHGKPYGAEGFGHYFLARCREAGVPGSGRGIRKAAATRAAENGATPHQLMAMFGWLSLTEAERYTKTANRRKLASDAVALFKR